jgi:hypothetical protein
MKKRHDDLTKISGKKKIIIAAFTLLISVATYYGVEVPEQLAPVLTEIVCSFTDCT